jgi:hypothetical protein
VDKMQTRRRAGLPQYRGPCVDNPCRCLGGHGVGQRRCVDDRAPTDF